MEDKQKYNKLDTLCQLMREKEFCKISEPKALKSERTKRRKTEKEESQKPTKEK